MMSVTLTDKNSKLMAEVELLREDKDMGEARHRFLFNDRHLPTGKDEEQNMEDWITSVKLSAEKMAKKCIHE